MLDLLERPRSSEALTNNRWRAATSDSCITPRFNFTDISSNTRVFMVPFGSGSLVFSEPPPNWFISLLTEIGQLGELEGNWDSYGAKPIDPRCAEATTNLLLSILDAHTPKPFVVPTGRGGIQLEWHRAGVDLEIEVEEPERVNVYFEDDREDVADEMTLVDDFRPLMRFLRRLEETD